MTPAEDINALIDSIEVVDISGAKPFAGTEKLIATLDALQNGIRDENNQRRENEEKLKKAASDFHAAVQKMINTIKGQTPQELMKAQEEKEQEERRLQQWTQDEIAQGRIIRTAAVINAAGNPLKGDTPAPVKAQFRKPVMIKFTA